MFKNEETTGVDESNEDGFFIGSVSEACLQMKVNITVPLYLSIISLTHHSPHTFYLETFVFQTSPYTSPALRYDLFDCCVLFDSIEAFLYFINV